MEATKTATFEITKELPVSCTEAYSAWTEPEQLKAWWKPIHNDLTEVNNDLQQGGKIQYKFGNDSLEITGEYQEVKENEKLVYTWNWNFANEIAKNGSYLLTVLFSDKDGKCALSISQESLADNEGTYPHKDGWEQGLNDLAAYLSDKSVAGNADSVGKSDSKNEAAAGYNEDPEQVKVGGG